MRLTDLMLTTLPVPEAGAKIYADDFLEGFGVRVSQGGTRSFVLTYGADRRRITIGRVGIIKLSEARGEAKRILAGRTLGKHLPGHVSAQDALDRFLAAKAEKNRPRTLQETTWLLRRHFKPLWSKRLADITHDDITRQIDRLLKDGSPSAANHATTAIKTFFRWCVTQRKYLPHSPIEGLQLPAKVESRDRVLSPAELKAIWAACDDTPFGRTVKLLMLTGQRRGEIQHLTLEGDLATLPDRFSKNGQSHTFPVPLEAAKLLATPLKWNSWSKSKAALDKRCMVPNFNLHDLRRTYSTTLGSLRVPPHIIEALLNHRTGVISGVAATYNRFLYLEEKREAVANFSRWIAPIVSDTVTPPGA